MKNGMRSGNKARLDCTLVDVWTECNSVYTQTKMTKQQERVGIRYTV